MAANQCDTKCINKGTSHIQESQKLYLHLCPLRGVELMPIKLSSTSHPPRGASESACFSGTPRTLLPKTTGEFYSPASIPPKRLMWINGRETVPMQILLPSSCAAGYVCPLRLSKLCRALSNAISNFGCRKGDAHPNIYIACSSLFFSQMLCGHFMNVNSFNPLTWYIYFLFVSSSIFSLISYHFQSTCLLPPWFTLFLRTLIFL